MKTYNTTETVHKLINENYPLAIFLAKRFYKYAFEDALSELNYLMLLCARNYKLNGPVPFSAYYTCCARLYMRHWKQKHKKRQAHNNSPLHENIPIPLSVQTTRHNPSDPQEYHQLILQIAKLCLTEAEFATIAHYKKLTQTQIAKKLNLAQTTISGLQRSAIRKLKHALLKGESHE